MFARCLGLVMLVAACGDDDVAPDASPDAELPDAAPDAAMPLAIEAPADVAEAALPDLLPCPTGWIEARSDGDVPVCAPFGGMRQTCTGSTAQRPNESACTRIGPECPDGDFPDDAPIDAIYVLAGARGTGTRDAPFGTLTEAIDAASPGAVIEIGKGVYDEAVVIERSIELRGACAAETKIAGVVDAKTLTMSPPLDDTEPYDPPIPIDVTLRALQIGSPTNAGIDARNGVHLTLEGVHLEATGTGGIAVVDGSLHATDVLVRDARGETDFAVYCGASDCVLRDVAIDGVRYIGLSTTGETDVENVAIIGSTEPHEMISGGMSVSSHAHARVRELVSIDTDAGLAVNSGSIDLDVSVFENGGALSLSFLQTAGGVIARTWVRGGVGARFLSTGSDEVTLANTIFERSTPSASYDVAQVLAILDGGIVRLDRVLVDRSGTIAITAGAGARLSGGDIVIRDIGAEPGVATGYGLMFDGVTADLSRIRIERTAVGGALVYGASVATLRDLTILETGTTNQAGLGVAAANGADLEIVRANIDHARTVGLLAVGAMARIHGSDIRITRTLADGRDGQFGRGIDAEESGSVDLERVALAQNRDHSVIAVLGGHVALRETSIVDSTRRECATSTCAETPYGIGVGVYDGELSLDGFELRRAALCAVQFGEGSTFALSRGVVADSMVGVCVDREEYDLADLEREVRYEGNDRNLDARHLPVPPPAPPIALPEL